jgi:uncharacterized protein YbaP (TraB family)
LTFSAGEGLQSAALQIRALRTLPVDQRISELEKLLAEKPEVAPGMELAYEAYRRALQKALDEAKAHPSSTRNQPLGEIEKIIQTETDEKDSENR